MMRGYTLTLLLFITLWCLLLVEVESAKVQKGKDPFKRPFENRLLGTNGKDGKDKGAKGKNKKKSKTQGQSTAATTGKGTLAPTTAKGTPTPAAKGTPAPAAKGTPTPAAKGTPTPAAKGTPAPAAKGTPTPAAKATPTVGAKGTPGKTSKPSGGKPTGTTTTTTTTSVTVKLAPGKFDDGLPAKYEPLWDQIKVLSPPDLIILVHRIVSLFDENFLNILFHHHRNKTPRPTGTPVPTTVGGKPVTTAAPTLPAVRKNRKVSDLQISKFLDDLRGYTIPQQHWKKMGIHPPNTDFLKAITEFIVSNPENQTPAPTTKPTVKAASASTNKPTKSAKTSKPTKAKKSKKTKKPKY